MSPFWRFLSSIVQIQQFLCRKLNFVSSVGSNANLHDIKITNPKIRLDIPAFRSDKSSKLKWGFFPKMCWKLTLVSNKYEKKIAIWVIFNGQYILQRKYKKEKLYKICRKKNFSNSDLFIIVQTPLQNYNFIHSSCI